MTVKNFRELRIWQEAQSLALLVYQVTGYFPPTEIYGLTSQMRRSASSIPSNIAEGRGRSTTKEYAYFLSIAHGSAQETMQHCLLAKELRYLAAKMADSLIARYDGLSAGIKICRANLIGGKGKA